LGSSFFAYDLMGSYRLQTGWLSYFFEPSESICCFRSFAVAVALGSVVAAAESVWLDIEADKILQIPQLIDGEPSAVKRVNLIDPEEANSRPICLKNGCSRLVEPGLARICVR
tara:strand:+ start:2395 stop:2733 length:339 start_codon:yes stop_codon:yes gene_type:complete